MKKLYSLTFLALVVFIGNQASAQTCQAGFTVSTNANLATFTNTSTGIPFMGAIATWDFGDGNTATTGGAMGTSHNYAASGVYLVCMNLTDSLGACNSTYCDSVLINTSSGTCSAYYGYSSVGCDVNFMDSSYTTASIVAWQWSFGDGTGSSVQNPTHTFSSGGPYTVCLTIYTSDSCTNSYCSYVYPDSCGSSLPCQASYYWYHDSLMAYTIILVNTSSGGALSSYSWDFGDGGTSTLAYPTHTYAGAGYYNVCVTIADSNCTSTYCDTLDVLYKTNTPFTINVIAPQTSVHHPALVASCKVYPNPFHNNFNVDYTMNKSSNVSFELYDIMGRMIYSRNEGMIQSGAHLASISPSNLDSGIYLLKINAGNESSYVKLIAE